jgi:hypothetical protein
MGAKVNLLGFDVVSLVLVVLGACAFAPFILAGRIAEREERRETMKLYAFQPKGHGEMSAFVMAESEQEARARIREAANAEEARRGWPVDLDGFDTDYYQIHALGPGEVVLNDND